MANQVSLQDPNQVATLMGASGTAGTAETRRILVNDNNEVVVGGTVRVNGRPAQNILSFGTTFSGTAAGYGTLVGSAVVGAGSSVWINDISIINPNGTVLCVIANGTALNGTSVFFKGVLGTQTAVGIQKSYPIAVNAGMANQDLFCYLGAAGTVDFSISYFISA